MSLKSLVLCADEKIVRVLRRVLGDLDIAVELCVDSDGALRRLTRQRFEAIIVDVTDDGASDVLRSARTAPCNRQAVAVAIVDPIIGLKAVFELGAHFVLYKPVSSERAKSSFRAARALMKSERRRNSRVAVEIPVVMRSPEAGSNMKVTTIDLSEGGMAVNVPKRRRPTGHWQAVFTLPGSEVALELPAEFAWEGEKAQAGLRFQQIPPEATQQLREWLKQNSPDAEQDDPPIRCQLTAGGLASARESLCRGLGSRWFTERFHRQCARNTLPARSGFLYRPAIEGLRCHPLPTSSTRAPEVTPN
jgi:DNA-binding response OmpR family regulator